MFFEIEELLVELDKVELFKFDPTQLQSTSPNLEKP